MVWVSANNHHAGMSSFFFGGGRHKKEEAATTTTSWQSLMEDSTLPWHITAPASIFHYSVRSYLLLLYQILDSTVFHIITAPACTVYLSLSYQILDSAMFHITTAPAYIVYRSLLHQFLDSAILPQHVLSIYHYRTKS